MASEVARVANRCNDAKANGCLDLSSCELMQMPHAIYLLMKETEVTECNLSNNHFTKLPKKMILSFPNLTTLLVQHNQIEELPEEIKTLENIQTLDISHNKLTGLPSWLNQMSSLCSLQAKKNRITDFDLESLSGMQNLQELDLTDNPISDRTKSELQKLPILKAVVKFGDTVET